MGYAGPKRKVVAKTTKGLQVLWSPGRRDRPCAKQVSQDGLVDGALALEMRCRRDVEVQPSDQANVALGVAWRECP